MKKKSEKIAAHVYFTANLRVWIRLVIKSGISISEAPKALAITLCILLSTPLRWIEYFIDYRRSKRMPQIKDPVFILGQWRSGTTYLHYLICQDKRFGFLTMYQSFIPNIAVAGGRFLKRIIGPAIPNKRPQDNIEIGMNLPAEEENSISNFATESASNSFFFPKDESYYQKYSLFDKTSAKEKSNWQKAYRRIIDKISWANNHKQLVIKNPHNTARIKELLELYPNAKFIHIHRDPVDVIPSSFLMYDKVITTQYLQDFPIEKTWDKIFYYHRTLMHRFEETKDLIPKEQFFEIRFEHLEKEPMHLMNKMYQHFGWDISATRESFEKFIGERKNYKKNKHEISEELRERIEKQCRVFMERYGYI